VIEELQGVAAGHDDSVLRRPDFADLGKYKVFDHIVAIANNELEPVSSSVDFSAASIKRRIAAGYRDAEIALTNPPKTVTDLKRAIPKLR
jgi:NTE family protein